MSEQTLLLLLLLLLNLNFVSKTNISAVGVMLMRRNSPKCSVVRPWTAWTVPHPVISECLMSHSNSVRGQRQLSLLLTCQSLCRDLTKLTYGKNKYLGLPSSRHPAGLIIIHLTWITTIVRQILNVFSLIFVIKTQSVSYTKDSLIHSLGVATDDSQTNLKGKPSSNAVVDFCIK